MPTCGKCKSARLHRSRSRSQWERWRKQITGKVVFRCGACGWRGWAFDADLVSAAPAAPATFPEPPNLRDSPLARTERGDIRLEELDRID